MLTIMRFIDAVEQGKVSWLGTPDRFIEARLSKIFFFGERALKVYKHVTLFYANLAEHESRKRFYTDDFFWNHTAAPETYTALCGVSDNSFEATQPDTATDWYIEMRALHGARTISELLPEGRLSSDNMTAFGDSLLKILAVLTAGKKDALTEYFNVSLTEWVQKELEDLRLWLHEVSAFLPIEESNVVIDTLQKMARAHPEFSSPSYAKLVVGIDNNSDNLLFMDGMPTCIDVMPPKTNWRVADERFILARTAVDAAVLGNPSLQKAVYSAYTSELPDALMLIAEVRAALIQCSYRHMLGEHDTAEKYKKWTDSRLSHIPTS